MKAIKGVVHLLSEARRQEQDGQPEEAAALYQQVLDNDPRNRDAIRRLLVLYRRLKNSRKELTVINAALAAFAQHDKTAQQAWMTAHPEAARAGKAILRSLGGQQVTAYGTDPMVEQLLKRKALVERRAGVAAAPRPKMPKAPPKAPLKTPKAAHKVTSVSKDKEKAKQAEKAKRAEQAKQAAKAEQAAKAAERKRRADDRARQQRERKEAAAARKEAAAARKAAAAAEQKRRALPSLYLIFLRYLVDLEEIDAMMEQHNAFLDKYFKTGAFLVAGRQVPRTGGVILARGKDRATVERITMQDPFVKHKLASVDIVEFKASRTGKGMKKMTLGMQT
jgi:uncharacterized protein YciI